MPTLLILMFSSVCLIVLTGAEGLKRQKNSRQLTSSVIAYSRVQLAICGSNWRNRVSILSG